MNGPANSAAAKNKRLKWVVVTLLAFVGGVTTLWLWFGGVSTGNSDPLFRGKPESEWIKNLAYSEEQMKEWQVFGEEGVQVLARGLQHAQRANRPGDRMYRRLHRQLPGVLKRILPWPKSDSTLTTRQVVSALLARLGKDGKSAMPAMARALKDEDNLVRNSAIIYFAWPPNADSVLSITDEREKRRILPDLIRVMQDGHSARLNGLTALKYFPMHKDVVVPIIAASLQDTNSQMRLVAAGALNRVDPDAAKKAGALTVLIKIAKDANDWCASAAVREFRYFHGQPELAVPALVESLESTNGNIACEAVWALEFAPKEFEKHVGTIIPALTKAAHRKDIGGYAKVALKRFELVTR